MKKLSILVALAMVMTIAGVASANTIIVPFFNDGGNIAGGSTNTGMRTYIRVKNLDSATIVCAITYVDAGGVDGTPVDNTFVLGPLATVGFRPVADDSVAEDAAGRAVPNALSTGTFAVYGGGGASIASANNIAGMVSEENWFVGGGSGIAPAIY